MGYLPGHLDNLATWIDLAEQVVVVDSFSTDGTVEFLEANLHHPNVLYVNHPPGLYASWNFGIRHVTSGYCYIATVGDSITREGIGHLVSTAVRLNCDVLVSQPDFVNESGQPCDGPDWPMADVIRQLGITEPVRLPSAIMVAAALKHTGGALTGSCASDLFCTATLKKHPFPLDFGTAGDGAWSLQNAGRMTWAATPEKMTTFRFHQTAASSNEVKAAQAADQFAQMAANVVAEWLESHADDVSTGVREDIKRLLPLCITYDQSRRRYNSQRIGAWPWILNPSAWMNRSKRNQMKPEVCSLMQQICRSCLIGTHASTAKEVTLNQIA